MSQKAASSGHFHSSPHEQYRYIYVFLLLYFGVHNYHMEPLDNIPFVKLQNSSMDLKLSPHKVVSSKSVKCQFWVNSPFFEYPSSPVPLIIFCILVVRVSQLLSLATTLCSQESSSLGLPEFPVENLLPALHVLVRI